MLPQLRQLGGQSRFPTALIVFLLNIWVNHLHANMSKSLQQANEVQLRLGVLPRNANTLPEAWGDAPLDLKQLHELLVAAFADSNTVVWSFVSRVSDALASCIDSIYQLENVRADSSLEAELWELKRHCGQSQAMICSLNDTLDNTRVRIDLCHLYYPPSVDPFPESTLQTLS